MPDWSTVDNEIFLADWAQELTYGKVNDDVTPLNVFAAMRACKASLKANDRLDMREMAQLVADVADLDEGAACPHGRPTRIVYDEHALDKVFQRLGH